VGSLLGKHGKNIANMSLSREAGKGRAFAVLNLDSEAGDELLKELESHESIISVRELRV
jgi:hypothetical protein